jgi:hypothetical protein
MRAMLIGTARDTTWLGKLLCTAMGNSFMIGA